MTTADVNLKELDKTIKEVKEKVQHIMELSGGMQCVDRNCERIMASIKMLELNICDVADIIN